MAGDLRAATYVRFPPVGFEGNRFQYWTYLLLFSSGLKHMEVLGSPGGDAEADKAAARPGGGVESKSLTRRVAVGGRQLGPPAKCPFANLFGAGFPYQHVDYGKIVPRF